MRKHSLLVVGLLAVVLLAGCSVNSKDDFVGTANTGTFITNGCTIGVESGLISKGKAEGIEVIIRTMDNCVDEWYFYLQDPNIVPPPDIVLCAQESVIQLIIEAKAAGVSTQEFKMTSVSDAEVNLAKSRLDSACSRYYFAVDNAWAGAKQ